jgi:hypothetical protein
MSLTTTPCAWCSKQFPIEIGALNRARRRGMSVYCCPRHSGYGRGIGRTKAEKRRLKAEYDRQYRLDNLLRITVGKRDYHRRTYDPKKAAKTRKRRMPYHVEYCRRPEYRAYKRQYDLGYAKRPERRDKHILYHYVGPTNPKDEKQWLSRNKATVRNLGRLCKSGKLYPEALSSLIARYGLEQISLT